MDISSWPLSEVARYGPGVLLVAAACNGLVMVLRGTPVVRSRPRVQAWLPVVPTLLGGWLGWRQEWLFPGLSEGARVFLGALSGTYMVLLIAMGRRVLRAFIARRTDEKTADAILAPVDEEGKTISPGDGERP